MLAKNNFSHLNNLFLLSVKYTESLKRTFCGSTIVSQVLEIKNCDESGLLCIGNTVSDYLKDYMRYYSFLAPLIKVQGRALKIRFKIP